MKRYPIVEVQWIDSAALKGWHQPESPAARSALTGSGCRSVGYLFHQDKRWLTLAQNTSDTSSVGEFMAIPRAAVTHITVLRKDKRKQRSSGSQGK